MNRILKRFALVDAQLEKLTQTEADLHSQFLELSDLREQLREAGSWRLHKTQRWLESPRQLLSPQSPSVRG